MSLYLKISEIGEKYISKPTLFKYGFNLSPMYRRSTGKILHVSEDLLNVQVKLPISYRNRNYVGSIFGGSMFSAVDPIPMVQLVNLLNRDYICWDKSAEIVFKAPAFEDLYASFEYSQPEVEDIKQRVNTNNEIDIIKTTQLTNKDKTKVFCEVRKTIYVATKDHYRDKKKKRLRDQQKKS